MKNIKPIAMKCNQEQFIKIKPKLKGFEIYFISLFSDCPYLVNNFEDKYISNTLYSYKDNKSRIVFEEWNENIFLEYCGLKSKLTLNDAYIVECKSEKETNKVCQHIKNEIPNCTLFEQDLDFITFRSEVNLDCIIKVIEY